MDMWHGMEPDPERDYENAAQMIFRQTHDECVTLRKQDSKYGVARDIEILLALESFADWQTKAGITRAELDQIKDIIHKERLEIEGR